MRYLARVEGTELRLELDQRGRLLVEGREIPADVTRTADGTWSVILDGRSHEIVFLDAAGTRVRVDGREVSLELVDEREQRAGSTARAASATSVEVRAPMPGLIVSVHVREGDVVDQGRALCTLEAMKMENDLVSPRRARVVRLAARQGAKVNGGDLLAVLGPE